MANERVLARQCFAKLVAMEERFLSSFITRYYILIDGWGVRDFCADSDDDAIKEFHEWCERN